MDFVPLLYKSFSGIVSVPYFFHRFNDLVIFFFVNKKNYFPKIYIF